MLDVASTVDAAVVTGLDATPPKLDASTGPDVPLYADATLTQLFASDPPFAGVWDAASSAPDGAVADVKPSWVEPDCDCPPGAACPVCEAKFGKSNISFCWRAACGADKYCRLEADVGKPCTAPSSGYPGGCPTVCGSNGDCGFGYGESGSCGGFGCFGNGVWDGPEWQLVGGTCPAYQHNACVASMCVCDPSPGSYDHCIDTPSCHASPVVCDDNNPCTTDACTPAIGCMHKPVTGDSCALAAGCGTCQSGVCVAGPGAKEAPLLDVQLPDCVTLSDVTPTSDGDIIAFGTAQDPKAGATGSVRDWVARFAADGKLAWQVWPAPKLPGYGHLAPRLAQGDLLLKAMPDGSQEHIYALTAKSGTVLETGYPTLTYQPDDPFSVVADAVMADDSLLRVRLRRVAVSSDEPVFKTVAALRAFLDGTPAPFWDALAMQPPLGTRIQGLAGQAVWLEELQPFPKYGRFCNSCGSYTRMTAVAPDGKVAWTIPDGSYYSANTQLLQVSHLDVAENGDLVAWGLRRVAPAESSDYAQHPAAAWLDPATGTSKQWVVFDELPYTYSTEDYQVAIPDMPDLSALLLPTSGIAVLDKGVLAWTDAQGNVLGDVVLPKTYAGMKLFARWPDGSIGLWSAHRIVRLPFQWAACP